MAKKRKRKARRGMAGRCREYKSGGIKRRVCWGKNGKIKSNKVVCCSRKCR